MIETPKVGEVVFWKVRENGRIFAREGTVMDNTILGIADLIEDDEVLIEPKAPFRLSYYVIRKSCLHYSREDCLNQLVIFV